MTVHGFRGYLDAHGKVPVALRMKIENDAKTWTSFPGDSGKRPTSDIENQYTATTSTNP